MVYLASYPGRVGGQKHFSPLTWPGYKAMVYCNLTSHILSRMVMLQLLGCFLVVDYCRTNQIADITDIAAISME